MLSSVVPLITLYFTLTNRECLGGVKSESTLRRNVFKDYDPAVRPVWRQNETVMVTFGVSLHQIIDLNEKNQILVSNMWIRQVWYNPFIFWEPKENGNITQINVSPRLLWKPDLVLYNNANDNSDGALNKFDTDIIVEFNGKNTWLAPVIFKSTCKINVAHFPFDDQSCTLKIGSWTWDASRLDLTPESHEGDIANFVSNGEWDLIEFKALRNEKYYICCKEPYPDLTFRLKIRRRTLFYYMNLLIPCFLLTGVNFLSFFLPPDSGERITLVVTSLLTMTVFMLLVAEIMPPVSDVVPVISIYYVTAMFVVGLSMAATCLVLRCYFRTADGMAMPVPLRFFIFQVLARIVGFKTSPGTWNGKGNINIAYATSTCTSPQRQATNNSLSRHSMRAWQDDLIVRNVGKITNILEDKMKSERKCQEWQEAAIIIDKFFFWLFIVVTAAGTIIMLVFLQPSSTT